MEQDTSVLRDVLAAPATELQEPVAKRGTVLKSAGT